MKYVITIEETISQDYEIEAESEENALRIAQNQYENGILVPEPINLTSKQMAITYLNEDTIWIKF